MDLDARIEQVVAAARVIWIVFMVAVCAFAGVTLPLWFAIFIPPISIYSYSLFQKMGAWWLTGELTREGYVFDTGNVDISDRVTHGEPIGSIDGITIYDHVEVKTDSEVLQFEYYCKAENETDLPEVEGLQFCHVDGIIYSRSVQPE